MKLFKPLMLLLLFSSCNLIAQHNLRRALSNEFTGLGSLWAEENLNETIPTYGTPLLFNNWPVGKVILENNESYNDVRCNYNSSENLMLLADPKTRAVYEIPMDKIASFSFEEAGQTRVFKITEGNKLDIKNVDKVLYEEFTLSNDQKLAKVIQKSFNPKDEFARPGDMSHDWNVNVKLYDLKNGAFEKFKNSRKGYMTILNSTAFNALKAHIQKTQDVSWKDHEEVLSFLASL